MLKYWITRYETSMFIVKLSFSENFAIMFVNTGMHVYFLISVVQFK